MSTKKAAKNKMQQAGHALQFVNRYIKIRADELEQFKEANVRSGIEARAYYADFLARAAAELLQIRKRIAGRSTSYDYLDTSWLFKSKAKRPAVQQPAEATAEKPASQAA